MHTTRSPLPLQLPRPWNKFNDYSVDAVPTRTEASGVSQMVQGAVHFMRILASCGWQVPVERDQKRFLAALLIGPTTSVQESYATFLKP
jgi:hypothetical protein